MISTLLDEKLFYAKQEYNSIWETVSIYLNYVLIFFKKENVCLLCKENENTSLQTVLLK